MALFAKLVQSSIIGDVLFLTLLFIQSSGQFSSIVVNGSYPITLPRSSDAMAVGYDSNTDTILLVGGLEDGSNNQFITFKNDQFVDYGSNYVPQGFDGYILFGLGQWYSQIDNTLWMLNAMTWEKMTPFNTNSWDVTDPSIAIPAPYESGDAACLASLNNGYNKYLFVVGVWPGNANDNYVALIYNISSSTWLTQTDIPMLNDNRYYLSCIVHNDRLYAIGGSPQDQVDNPLDTVEFLYVGDDLANIRSESWQYTINTLSASIQQTRAVVYDDNIFVLTNEISDVNIINTITNRISVGGILAYSYNGHASAAIVVNHILYMFGGNSVNYQYIDLQSITPTAPTIPTTAIPTAAIPTAVIPTNAGTQFTEFQPIPNNGNTFVIGLLVFFAIVNVVFIQ